MADRTRHPGDKHYRIRPVRRDVIDVDKFARGLLRLVQAKEVASPPAIDRPSGGRSEAP